MAAIGRPLVVADDAMVLPKLVVFDLDMCLWYPEMYTLDELPVETVRGPLGEMGEGVVAVFCGTQKVQLFPGALTVLQDISQDYYSGLRIAAASSADTPRAVQIAKACMAILEILPGVTMKEVFAKGWPSEFHGNVQIGRSPPLSSDKGKSHFPILRKETGVEYDQMVFFDDCNWEDNCREVARKCPGVTTQATPRGLRVEEWRAALTAFSLKDRCHQQR